MLLPPDEVVALTGHPPGGVCPFGLATPLPIPTDVRSTGLSIAYRWRSFSSKAVRARPILEQGQMPRE